jgi:hypothetical protein
MVDLGGATTCWFPAGEWREGERVIDLQEKKKKLFAVIFFRNDDI